MRTEPKPDWDTFYNWPATINKMEGAGAVGCMVVGANNAGKTFGLRYKCVENALKRKVGQGHQFAEICRTKNEVSDIASDYCTKLRMRGFFEDYEFNTMKGVISCRRYDTQDEFEPIGYVVALNSKIKSKRITYPDIGYTVMDEAVIEHTERYTRYLPDEWGGIYKLCVAMWREEKGRKSPGRVFLLGNSVDITCPYFERLGVGIPSYGQRWCLGKTWLFDYVKPSGNHEEYVKHTNAFRLFQSGDTSASFNQFSQSTDSFIEEKPEDSQYLYAIVFLGITHGIWRSQNGVYHVTRKLPRDMRGKRVYSLTTADNEPDYNMARASDSRIKVLINAYCHGNMRFSDAQERENFLNVLKCFGLR